MVQFSLMVVHGDVFFGENQSISPSESSNKFYNLKNYANAFKNFMLIKFIW